MAAATGRTRGRPKKAAPVAIKKADEKPEQTACVAEQLPTLPEQPAPTMEEPAPARAEDDCGLVSNGSLSDSEVLDMMAPAEAIEEEKRLQKEREEHQSKTPTTLSLKCTTLDQGRFAALEHLLRQADAYAMFLASQMDDIEQGMEPVDAVQAGPSTSQPAPVAKGGKRGRGKGKASADGEEQGPSKKGKASSSVPALTPTQRLLPLLKADLRDYQLKGVKWLVSLYQNGINGILADQMGLGKTVQTLGFLSYLRNKGIFGPFMVIGPLSTLPNWMNEFQRFLPAQPVIMYHGTKAEREDLRTKRLTMKDGKVTEDFPAIVTSYEIVIADARFLSKLNFKYVIVDEGHRLKNANCRLLRELKTIPTENKLLLSGTPLQNNLSELWSLLNFLMPEVFKDMLDFEAWFDFSSVVGQAGADKEILAAEQRNKVISKLHAILKPFMLRRLKSDVDIELPRKMEFILYAPMTETQKQLNEQLKEGKLLAEMVALAEQEGANAAAAGKLSNVLMQMRKICNHPDLITSAFSNDINFPPPEVLVEQCGKMALLDRLLETLHKKKHKVLIFSQMVKVLDIIESYAEQKGHKACRLDGSVSWQDRQANINSFNTDQDTWLFLLSTRAGGLGINLTAADTVIIYDSDWNPHQDLQAMDRCHRIGQQKPVLVFRLATSHSVEGKMLKRAADKMALERLVIKKGAFTEAPGAKTDESKNTMLSTAELLELLQGNYRLDDLPQSGSVSVKVLEQLLNRDHMLTGAPLPYPASGVGYEVVQGAEATGILQNINK